MARLLAWTAALLLTAWAAIIAHPLRHGPLLCGSAGLASSLADGRLRLRGKPIRPARDLSRWRSIPRARPWLRLALGSTARSSLRLPATRKAGIPTKSRATKPGGGSSRRAWHLKTTTMSTFAEGETGRVLLVDSRSGKVKQTYDLNQGEFAGATRVTSLMTPRRSACSCWTRPMRGWRSSIPAPSGLALTHA